ncbi:MAG TPA: AMP-binding protein [Paludibacteraceae bacterium]|nr:AMP-binding protein [Paludibacteraceae bacterium]
MKTIIHLFEESVEKYAQNAFLWEKKSDKFEPTTYAQTRDEVYRVGAGLMSLGLAKGDKVSLLSEGRNAWIISELGILYAGAINVPLSIKLEEKNDLIFRITHSDSKMIVVSGANLGKIRVIIKQLPAIEKVIVLDKQEAYEPNELFYGDLVELGNRFLTENRPEFEARFHSIIDSDYANISYTSGTTADPKGILLTHRNYTANVEQAYTLMTIPENFRTLIILPLDHCFAHVAGFYSFMGKGASVATVQTGKTGLETLKNIPINIKEIKPDLLLSVPALAKNFKKNIESTIKAQGKLIHMLFNHAVNMAISYNKEGHNKGGFWHWWKKPFLALYDKILFSKVREAFGGNLKFFIGGGALLDIDLQRFYYAIGVPMMQGYGLSEATPIISSNSIDNHILGSSGHIVKPMDIKICDEQGNALPFGEKGEIVIRGENVMAGYWKNPKATAETIKDGWLYTGDMGYMIDEDFLYVVGRFKSLLISADGEKYSPEGIEESIVQNSRYIDQMMMYNNQNPYTIALIVPNKEALKRYVHHKHPDWTWDSVEAKELALNKIQREFNEYRKGGKFHGTFPERWLPAAIGLLPEAFTEQNQLMNSTMKMVRGKIEKRYEDRINYLYSAEGKNIINTHNIEVLN